MYNGLVHIKAVPSSALQQSWTDSSHRGWVFRGHQQSQDQARGDTALLTSGLASSPSTLPLEAPTAPSPLRVLLGPFIAFFFRPADPSAATLSPPGTGGPTVLAIGTHRAPAPERGTTGLCQRRRRFGMRQREPPADGALAATLLRD